MGAAAGVLKRESSNNSTFEEKINAISDILKFDQTRRQFGKFMQNKKSEALLNFCLQLETLLTHHTGTFDSLLGKVDKICSLYVKHSQIIEHKLVFSYPWPTMPYDLESLELHTNTIVREIKLYLADSIDEFKCCYSGGGFGPSDLGSIKEATTVSSHVGTSSPNLSSPHITPRNSGVGGGIGLGHHGTPRNSGVAVTTGSGSNVHTPRSSCDPLNEPRASDCSSNGGVMGSPGSAGRSNRQQPSTFPDKYPRVLVVDDSEPVTRSLKKMFEEAKHLRVMCATDGQQAVDMFEEAPFNIILIDIHMPIMGGLEAVERIRRIEDDRSDKCGGTMASAESTGGMLSFASNSNDSPFLRRSRGPSLSENKQCLIIAISGDDSDSIVDAAFESGADAFLFKPEINIRTVGEIVTRQVNSSLRLSQRDK